MKRFFLPSVLILLSMTVSCIEEPEVQTDPFASINYFALGYYDVRFHDVNAKGRDTIIYNREAGYMYPMTIDQRAGKIYNIDSLGYGSVIRSVTASISATGSVLYRYTDVPDPLYYVWTSYDTIDFTRPLIFSVVSTDGSFVRDYDLKVNVHKVFPDSLIWKDESAGYTPFEVKSMAIRSDTVYAFGLVNDIPNFTCRSILSGTWSAFEPMIAIDHTWDGKVIANSNVLYAVNANRLCYSTNGANWYSSPIDFMSLNASTDASGSVWATDLSGQLVSSKDMNTWTSQVMPDGFPSANAITSSKPLATNPNIIRTIAVGVDTMRDSVNAQVWTMLSSDSVWTLTEPAPYSKYRLPALDGFSMISYDGALFAFGKGLECFWQSIDNGITWHKCERCAQEYSSFNQYMQMPAALVGNNTDFAYAVDRLGSIWIMTSDGQVWRGAINRLNKR